MTHDVVMYRVFDKATGLYKHDGNNWNKRGKFYAQINHIKAALLQIAQDEARLVQRKEAQSHGVSEWDMSDATRFYWRDLRDNRERRGELYAYLPATWVVLQLQGGEWVEISTAREFWRYRK